VFFFDFYCRWLQPTVSNCAAAAGFLNKTEKQQMGLKPKTRLLLFVRRLKPTATETDGNRNRATKLTATQAPLIAL